MVMMCGPVQSDREERFVRLYNACSQSLIMMHPNGTVVANKNKFENPYQKFHITSNHYPDGFALKIFAIKARRYLCFDKSQKLVGLNETEGAHCEFFENISNGYITYRSRTLKDRYIMFRKNGQPVKRRGRGKPKCNRFLKYDPKFSIDAHNKKMGGGTGATGVQPTHHPTRHHHRQNNRRHGSANHLKKRTPPQQPLTQENNKDTNNVLK